jgi:hypothetical protein
VAIDTQRIGEATATVLDGFDVMYGEDAELRAFVLCAEVTGTGRPSPYGPERGEVGYWRVVGNLEQAAQLLRATLEEVEGRLRGEGRA